MDENHFSPIDGLRSISCLMIISVHLISFLSIFLPVYPDIQWFNYLKSYSFRLTPLLVLSLETFFMISAFLLTNKFLHQRKTHSNGKEFFSEYPTYIFRRACRYWPGILLASLIVYFLGDIQGNYLSIWLFFQNCVSMESWSITMGPLWSVSLDMHIHLILPLILFLIYSFQNRICVLYSLYFLVISSILYIYMNFNPKTMNILPIISKYNIFTILTPETTVEWINTKFNTTIPFIELNPNPVKIFMEELYMPTISRYGSFLIGSILAIKLHNSKSNENIRLNKYFYLILICFYMIILVSSPTPSIENEQIVINEWIFIIFTCCNRQLFAICQAFLLFTTLCPESHPYHCSFIKSFLSLRIWSPIAKLSYLIYVIHFPIAFHLIMNGKFNKIDGSSMDYLTLYYLFVVLIICLLVASIWHRFVEKPFQIFIHRILIKNKNE